MPETMMREEMMAYSTLKCEGFKKHDDITKLVCGVDCINPPPEGIGRYGGRQEFY